MSADNTICRAIITFFFFLSIIGSSAYALSKELLLEERHSLERIPKEPTIQIEEQEDELGNDPGDILVIPEDDELTKEEVFEALTKEEQEVNQTQQQTGPRRISAIHVHGNALTPSNAILAYVPYKIGEIFTPHRTGELIRNIYYGLGRFGTITVKGENVGANLMNLHIIVEEKPILKDVILEGNKKVGEKEIRKQVNFDVPALDEAELKTFAMQIKKVYVEKGFNQTTITPTMSLDNDGKVTATFTINEGKKATVKRIQFEGNTSISSKQLRKILLTKEDWILGFMDRAGSFHAERLEGDKHMIEQHYQNNGFMQAKVIDMRIEPMPDTPEHLMLTFEVEEGKPYTIGSVKASGNDIIPDEYLVAMLPLRVGRLYSREKVGNAIKSLERIWGNYGYVFAHIDPSLQPNEKTQTVDIEFISELGSKVNINRINIKGNSKTRDKIIRRRLMVQEGELVTQSGMELSKQAIESLGYFDQRDGVNWKIQRLGSDQADLDLIIREAKTGSLNLQVGFGGAGANLSSPSSSVTVKGGVADTNLFGSGVHLNLEGSWSKDEQSLNFHMAQPWLMDKPFSGAVDIYHKRPTYNDLKHLELSSVSEKRTGGALTVGFITRSAHQLLAGTNILGSFGIDGVRYENRPRARILGERTTDAAQEYQCILDQLFACGDFLWLANSLEQDTRNHPMHTSRGHKWKLITKVGIPTYRDNIGFFKMSLDVAWFTPLINEFDLVLKLHGFAGVATPFKNKTIPFGELYHMGGDTSVRGFNFGQIGPKFLGDPIGGRKAFYVNAELIFPITADMNMKGVAFYDGGAGWDTPHASCISTERLTGNSFDYRHAVGFGLRLLNPMPVRVDWGFKIDPRRDKNDPSRNESSHEVHFGMTYDW